MLKPRGIITAMATPLTADDEFDKRALRRITRHFIDGGAHGVIVMGSQGEF